MTEALMDQDRLAFIRPAVRQMTGYTPGEQPQEQGYIKLNTNENPYPPSPRVLTALKDAITGERLRKYPDPTGRQFRLAASRVLGVDPDAILIGNGSDEILTLLVRALVPEGGTVVAPTPSYLLYATLAAIQGARCVLLPFSADWQLDVATVPPDADLSFVPNPNSPSGTLVDLAILADWPTPLVIDEAYVDFANRSALSLLGRSPHLLITRSLSKSYSLAGIRFGFALGDPAVIRELYKVKDSYNCDALSLIAATAAIEDQEYLATVRDRILTTRARMVHALTALGFHVIPSEANFVWCRWPGRPLQPLYAELKARRILVRYMSYPIGGEGLRISVGTEEEIDTLLDQLRRLV